MKRVAGTEYVVIHRVMDAIKNSSAQMLYLSRQLRSSEKL
jgi:hypothetical protein